MDSEESETARLAPAGPAARRWWTRETRQQCEVCWTIVCMAALFLGALLLSGLAIGLCVFVFETGLHWGLNPHFE